MMTHYRQSRFYVVRWLGWRSRRPRWDHYVLLGDAEEVRRFHHALTMWRQQRPQPKER